MKKWTVLLLILCLLTGCAQPSVSVPQWNPGSVLSVQNVPELEQETAFFRTNMERSGFLIQTGDDLRIDLDPDMDDQAFRIEVKDCLYLKAGSAAGIQYGLNYIWKALCAGCGLEENSIIESAPAVRERAVLLDCGRKYYTPEQVCTLLETMAQNNMNALVLHFAEESGIRLESGLYEWIAGSDVTLSRFPESEDPDQGKYWTRQEMDEIIRHAAHLHIEIIPSFDTPGHCTWLLSQVRKHLGKDFRTRYTINDAAGEYVDSTFDLSNPEARAFLEALIDDYASYFASRGCTSFDLGGDEMFGSGRTYIGTDSRVKWQALDAWKEAAVSLTGSAAASAYDLFIQYINTEKDRLLDIGYQSVRMWNDELYRTHDTAWNQVLLPDPDLVIEWWNSDGGLFLNQPEVYASRGHTLINCTNFYNYYILDADLRYLGVHPDAIYREYSPFRFLQHSLDPDCVSGSCFCIWADQPGLETGREVLENTEKLLFCMAAKDWDPALCQKSSYSQMERLYEALYSGSTSSSVAST